MPSLLWRVVPLAVPVWSTPCSVCGAPDLASTERFRVNANGRRLDIWLVYRCVACGARRKRSVHRRVSSRDPRVTIDAYRADDAHLALATAFSFGAPASEIGYRVVRAALPEDGVVDVEIDQPWSVSVRIDRFLARELGWSRTEVQRAMSDGRIVTDPLRRPSATVGARDRLRIDLDREK